MSKMDSYSGKNIGYGNRCVRMSKKIIVDCWYGVTLLFSLPKEI